MGEPQHAVTLSRVPKILQAVLLLLLAVSGLLMYVINVEQTSPVASVDLRLSRKDVTSKARGYASLNNFDTANCIESTVFNCDQSVKTFLEYRLGLKEANRLMRADTPVWYWSTRFCRPKAHEEFTTRLSPDGRLVGLEHVIQHERPLKSLTHEEAKKVAEQFVEGVAGYELQEFRLFEDDTVPRSHRTDHSFTWLDSKRVDGAGIFISVDISGTTVSKFSRALGTPESWDSDYRGLRSCNEALQSVANVAHWTLLICAFGVVLAGISKREINLRLTFVVASLVTGLEVINTFNSLPYEFAAFDKAEPVSDFWIELLGKALSTGFWQMLETFLVVAAGEHLYRKAYPDKVALNHIFAPAAMRLPDVQKQVFIGYAAAGAWLGWNTIYYLVGKSFDFFSPLDWPLEAVLSSAFEMLNAVNVGVSASINEEFMYRAVALLLLQRLVKNFWIANIIQAAAWSFGHSNYPQEPPFVRGMELLMPGLVGGWLIRHYGILPCLVGHYLYDVFLGVFPLLQSPLASIRFPALLPMLPFALMPFCARFFPKAAPQDLSNAAVEIGALRLHEPHPTALDVTRLSKPLSGPQRAFLFAVCIVGLIGCLNARFPIVGQTATIAVSRAEAERLARRYMIEHKLMPDETLMSTSAVNLLSANELQYVFESTSLKETLEFGEVPKRALAWGVRFFTPGQTNEQTIYVLNEHGHAVPDLTQDNGYIESCLSEEEARLLASGYLKNETPEFWPAKYKACSTRRYAQRVEHQVSFTVPRLKMADADYVVQVQLSGKTVAKVNAFLDVPDDWQLAKNSTGTRGQVNQLLQGALMVVLSSAFVLWIIGVYRAAGFHLRGGLFATLPVLIALVLGQYNRLPLLVWNYDTDQALIPFILNSSFESIPAIGFYVGAIFLLTTSSLAALRILAPGLTAAQILSDPFCRSDSKVRAQLWIDGVLSGYACIILMNSTFALIDALLLPLAADIQVSSLDAFCVLINTFSPFVAGLVEFVRSGVMVLFGMPVAVGMYMRFVKTPIRFWLMAIVGCVLYSAAGVELYQQLFAFACSFFMIMIGWIFARKFIRLNPIGYVAAGGCGYLINQIRSLSLHGSPTFSGDIACLAIFLSLPPVYAIYLLIKSRYGRCT